MRNEQPRKTEIEVAIGKEHPKSEAEEMQLPLERLMPFPLLQTEGVNGVKTCELCEYILHYVQDAITNPITEVMNINFMNVYTYMCVHTYTYS